MTQWKTYPDTTPPRGLPLRLEVKEKDQNTGTPEPYYGKTLFRGLRFSTGTTSSRLVRSTGFLSFGTADWTPSDARM